MPRQHAFVLLLFFISVQVGEKWRFAMLNKEDGKVGWILLWALGVPIPVLLLLFLLRGCT